MNTTASNSVFISMDPIGDRWRKAREMCGCAVCVDGGHTRGCQVGEAYKAIGHVDPMPPIYPTVPAPVDPYVPPVFPYPLQPWEPFRVTWWGSYENTNTRPCPFGCGCPKHFQDTFTLGDMA